jgi:hypothetical protein
VDRPTQWRQAFRHEVTRAQFLAEVRAAEAAERLQQATIRRVTLNVHASVCRLYDMSDRRLLPIDIVNPRPKGEDYRPASRAGGLTRG